MWHIITLPFLAVGQSCGLTDTVFIDPDTNGSFSLNIADFVNDNLADPAQGLCGIELKFKHTFVEYFELSLTSPGGQTVQLIGPNTGQFGTTISTTWDISFIPSTEPAMPDSSFLDRWDNDQASDFGAGFLYTGAYYPFNGNLENFTTGAVNGVWTFNYKNSPSPFNSGAILFARLIFCDSRGVDCCFGIGGELRAPNVLACEGDSSLLIDPDPFFSAGVADTAEYDYTYLLAKDSVVIGFDTMPDFQAFPAGHYQICGLSYRATQVDSLSLTIGALTIDSLNRNLNSFFPLFCGNLSDNCINIQIEAPPDTTFLIERICEGDSIMVGDSIIHDQGHYVIDLQSFAGCDSIVDLDLSVVTTIVENLNRTICEGDSFLVGNTAYMIQGNYTDTLQTAFGCDSIVNLSLEVLQPLITNLTELICPGEAFAVGDSLFTETGIYQVQLLSSRNCDSIVNLNLRVLDLQINIPVPDTITCYNNGITLDASASTPVGGIGFNWQDLNGNTLGGSPLLTITVAYTVVLTISRSENGTSCVMKDTIIVYEDREAPIADAGLPGELSCSLPQLILGGGNTSTGPEFTYLWETTDGQIIGANTEIQSEINAPGTYRLRVTNSRNGCETIDEVFIGTDNALPIADAGPDTLLTCAVPSITLGGGNTSTGPAFIYVWLNTSGTAIGGAISPTLVVTEPGLYTLVVTNILNGCIITSTVTVGQDIIPPNVAITPPDLLNCAQTTLVLDASAADQGANFDLLWQASNGGNIQDGQGTPTPTIDATGTYELQITNLSTGCQNAASIVVQDTLNNIVAEVLPPATLTCEDPSINLSIGNATVGPDIQYFWTSSQGHFVSPPIGSNVEVDAPGNYTLIVVDTFTQCADTVTVVVNQDVGFPVAEAGDGFTITCALTEDTLTSQGSSVGPDFSYLWQGPCIQTDPNAEQISVNCPGTYYLEIRNTSNQCVSIDSVVVNAELEIPLAAISEPDTLTCRFPQITLDGGPSSSSGGLAFRWDGPGILADENTPQPTVNQIGTYRLMVTDLVSLCTDTMSIDVVNAIDLPLVDLGADTSITCDNPTLTLGGGSNSAGPAFRYRWVALAGSLPAQNTSPTLTVDDAGIFRLIIENNLSGCRDSSTLVVSRADALPFVNAGDNQVFFCDTDSILLFGNTNIDPANATIQWSGPCLPGTTDSLMTTIECPGDYILTVENNLTGCVNRDTLQVTLSNLVPLAVLPDTMMISCETGQAILDGSASTFGVYEWRFNGALLPSSNNIIGANQVGRYTLTVTNLDGSCSDMASVEVLEDCGPQIVILPPDRLNCMVSSIIIDASNSTQGDNITFEWITPDAACLLSGEASPIIEVTCGGEYQLVLTNTEVMLSDTQSVFVLMDTIAPMAEAGVVDTITCTIPTVELNGSGSSQGVNMVYEWSNLNTAEIIGTDIIEFVGSPGTYILQVKDTSNFCTDQDIVQIRIDENVPQINFGNQLFPCDQTTFDLESIITPPGNNYQYEWTGPGIVAGADQATVRINALGTYRLSLVDVVNGCIDVDSVLIEEQDCIPCIQLLGPDTLAINCLVDTLDINAAFCDECIDCVVQWSTIGGNIIGEADSLGLRVDASGTYILSVTDLAGFTSTLEVVVLDQTLPPLADGGPDRFLSCDSLQVTLGSNASTQGPSIQYQWLNEIGQTIGQNLFLPIAQPGTFTFEVVDNLTGCRATDVVVVSQSDIPPIAEAGPNQTLTCQSDLVVLNGSGSATGGNIRYQWRANLNVGCLEGASTTNPIATCPGLYFLQVTDVQSGCISVDSVLVELSNDLPVLEPIPDTALSCGDTLLILNGALPPQGNFSFQWCQLSNNNQPIFNTCEAVLDYQVRTPGRYRFSVQDTNNGCVSRYIVNVNADTIAPNVEAGQTETLVCTEPSMQLTGLADALNRTYQWSALNGSQIDDANTLTPTIFSPDTFVLAVTNTLNQCTATDTLVILRDANAPIADAGPDASLNCNQEDLQLNGVVSTNSGQSSFSWSTNDGNFLSSTNQLNPRVNKAGVYYLTVSDPLNQCMSVDSVLIINDISTPLAQIAGLDTLMFDCENTRLTLDATASTAIDGHSLTFQWTALSSGQVIGDPNSPIVMAEGVGNYRLLVIDQENSCQDTLRFSLGGDFKIPVITIAPIPELNCNRNSVLLDATASANPGLVISWTDGNGNNLSANSPTLSVSQAGKYTIRIVDETNGCEQTRDLNVLGDTIRPIVSIAPAESLDCANSSVTLTGNSPNNGPNFVYQWRRQDGTLLDAGGALKIEVASAGTYLLSVKNTRNGCEASDSVLVEALSRAIVGTALQVLAPGCSGRMSGRIQVDSILGGTGPFLFALNGTAFSANSRFDELPPGTYQLKVEDALGCTWEETVIVPEEQGITVDLGPDLEIKFGAQVLLEAITNASNIASITWLPAEGDTLANPLQQLVTPTHSNKYAVTIIDEQGCQATDEIIILVLERKRFYGPTVFSPDENGNNDSFTLFGGNDIKEIRSFQIFDRWGNKVFDRQRFQPNDPSLGWDGNFNGQPMNAAVYVYYAEIEYIDGRIEQVKGDVTLIR
ncbi:MAG: gliding motility-associated C-terminal domain-containing protein [Saprospiraceae bacterium]